jgi:hypothetical protein
MLKEIVNQKIYNIFFPIMLYCIFLKISIYLYLNDILSENLFLNQYFNKLLLSLISVYFLSGLISYIFIYIKNLIYIFCFLFYILIFLSDNANINITLIKFENIQIIKKFNNIRYYINCVLIFYLCFFSLIFIIKISKKFSDEIDNNLKNVDDNTKNK